MQQQRYVIMDTGFKNTFEGSVSVGYQLNIREPYYRGTFLSSVDFLELSVDGQKVPRDNLRIVVSGKTFSMAQMEEADDMRWGYGDPATLLVHKTGGLVPGLHEIRLGAVIRKSYFPATDPEHLYAEFGLWKSGSYHTFIEAPEYVTKRMTLVQ